MSVVQPFIRRRIMYRTLRPQLAIVSLISVAFALDMVAVYLSMGNAVGVYGGVAVLLVLFSVLVPFVAWFGATAVIYVVSRLLGAQVQFGILLRATGLASVPAVGTGVCLSLGRYLALRTTTPCDYAGFTCDPSFFATLPEQASSIHAFTASAASNWVFQVSFAVGLGFLLLTGYLWIVAADEASTLTKVGAVLVISPMIILLVGVFAYVTL